MFITVKMATLVNMVSHGGCCRLSYRKFLGNLGNDHNTVVWVQSITGPSRVCTCSLWAACGC